MTLLSASAEAALYHDPNRSGFVALRFDQRQSIYRVGELADVLEKLFLNQNLFLSQGEFYKPTRRLVHLSCCPALFADLETFKVSGLAQLSPEQQAQCVLLFLEEKGIPRPSLINFSGRGLHVKWILDSPVPAFVLPRWNAVQRCLVEALNDFGVDKAARDGSRCLRLVGSRNPRSGEVCRTIYMAEHGGELLRWDFEAICREVLPKSRQECQPKSKKGITASGRPENLWTARQLWWARLTDLRTLIGLRGWTDGVPVGYRNNFLFVACCAVCWGVGTTELEAETVALAHEFCLSLPVSMIRSTCSSAIARARKGDAYRLTNDKIIELLEISEDEQRLLSTIRSRSMKRAARKEYDHQYNGSKTYRETYLLNAEQRRQQAKQLREQGLSYKAIGVQMGCSVNAVDKLLRSGRSPPYIRFSVPWTPFFGKRTPAMKSAHCMNFVHAKSPSSPHRVCGVAYECRE